MSRCPNRFVRYPYPKGTISRYKIDYSKKNSYSKPSDFNLEKESKIINPHKMDLRTTMQELFKGDQTIEKLMRKIEPQSE